MLSRDCLERCLSRSYPRSQRCGVSRFNSPQRGRVIFNHPPATQRLRHHPPPRWVCGGRVHAFVGKPVCIHTSGSTCRMLANVPERKLPAELKIVSTEVTAKDGPAVRFGAEVG